MKKIILLFFLIAALCLSACVYENPNFREESSTESDTRAQTDGQSTADTEPAVTSPSTETDPPATSEFPNDTDDSYSKRY